MRSSRFAWLSCIFLALPACGDDGGGGGGDDDGSPDADPNDPPDADNADFVELISREWTLPPGEEYKCVGVIADRDYWISTFRTANPLGEHHAVLTVADAPGGFGGTQLGEYDCDVSTLGLEMLFASGVGTDDLVLPEGVAIKIEEGQFVHLNLHLFNTQASGDIVATSSILVKTVEPVAPAMEAEMVFAGNMDFTIPANSTGTVVTGGCDFSQDQTIFAYWPHMHQYAVHQKVTMTIDGTEMVLHDDPYSFEEQTNYPLNPMLQVGQGDSIQVDCTFDNPTNQPITWGDSSTKEMCFTGMYRYPKHAFTLFDCSTGAGGGF